jgi:hypothetical protein
MRILASLTPRRRAVHATIAVLVGTASAAGVAFAGSSGGPVADKGATPTVSTASAANPIASAARTALDRLVANGAIDQAQADTIEQQVEVGSVDPRALIDAGTVTQAQMQAVADALDQAKRSTSSLRLGLRSGLSDEKKLAAQKAKRSTSSLGLRFGRLSDEKEILAEQKAKLDAETKKDGGAPAGYVSGTP